MTIRTVIFDIGGVLEITPRTGWDQRWESLLQVKPGELRGRLRDVFRGGSIGTLSEAEVEEHIGTIMEITPIEVNAFMADLWVEYLGELNVDLTAYFASLRPRYQTGILSNSFVGARHKEQKRYGFDDLCDCIIYSHEEGMQKPDPRFYALACTRFGVQPGEVLFLDDTEECVTAARACGIRAILFTETNQAIADIQAVLEHRGQQ